MSTETLLTASRRVVRFFNADMNKGGLITESTQHAIETLDQQISLEAERRRNACPGCNAKIERTFSKGDWWHEGVKRQAPDV